MPSGFVAALLTLAMLAFEQPCETKAFHEDERWKNTPPDESFLQTKEEECCVWQQLLWNQAIPKTGNQRNHEFDFDFISYLLLHTFQLFFYFFLGSGETRKEPLSFFAARVHNHTQYRHTQLSATPLNR